MSTKHGWRLPEWAITATRSFQGCLRRENSHYLQINRQPDMARDCQDENGLGVQKTKGTTPSPREYPSRNVLIAWGDYFIIVSTFPVNWKIHLPRVSSISIWFLCVEHSTTQDICKHKKGGLGTISVLVVIFSTHVLLAQNSTCCKPLSTAHCF